MTYAAMMVEKYKSRGLLLDSNLLLLYLVGAVDPTLVGTGQYNKLSTFKVEQIIMLRQLIAFFPRVVTTAHVLTEVSYLVNDMREAGKQRVFRAFSQTLHMIDEQKYRAIRPQAVRSSTT